MILCLFVLSLVSLRQTQSDLIIEPRIKQVHPVLLTADALFAIGDLHGDLEQGLAALKLAGLVNNHGLWSGGKAVVIQTGDLLDRGPDGLGLVQLFERIKVNEASVALLRQLPARCLVLLDIRVLAGRGKCSRRHSAHTHGQS